MLWIKPALLGSPKKLAYHSGVGRIVLQITLYQVHINKCSHKDVILLFYPFERFSNQRLMTIFHWGFNYSMSPQVSRTLLSILADLYNDIVWMVSCSPLISKSSCLCTNLLVTVTSAPIITRYHRHFYCYHYCYFIHLRDFDTSVNWWSSTEIWVRASLPKSPGLFSVFWPSLTL